MSVQLEPEYAINQFSALNTYFENTYYWYQTQEKNPQKLTEIIDAAKFAIEWLIEKELVEQHSETLLVTPLGKAASISGLLPSTVIAFVEALKVRNKELENNFDLFVNGLLHWVCSCEEFQEDRGSRFLAYPSDKTMGSTAYLAGYQLLIPLDRTNTRLNQCVHALCLYIQGEAERKIRHMSGISSGSVHRLAVDVSWILDGLHRISCVSEVVCSQQLSNRLSMLTRRVRWGAPPEVLDVIRVAERHAVPGFGRQRGMALFINPALKYPVRRMQRKGV